MRGSGVRALDRRRSFAELRLFPDLTSPPRSVTALTITRRPRHSELDCAQVCRRDGPAARGRRGCIPSAVMVGLGEASWRSWLSPASATPSCGRPQTCQTIECSRSHAEPLGQFTKRQNRAESHTLQKPVLHSRRLWWPVKRRWHRPQWQLYTSRRPSTESRTPPHIQPRTMVAAQLPPAGRRCGRGPCHWPYPPVMDPSGTFQ